MSKSVEELLKDIEHLKKQNKTHAEEKRMIQELADNFEQIFNYKELYSLKDKTLKKIFDYSEFSIDKYPDVMKEIFENCDSVKKNPDLIAYRAFNYDVEQDKVEETLEYLQMYPLFNSIKQYINSLKENKKVSDSSDSDSDTCNQLHAEIKKLKKENKELVKKVKELSKENEVDSKRIKDLLFPRFDSLNSNFEIIEGDIDEVEDQDMADNLKKYIKKGSLKKVKEICEDESWKNNEAISSARLLKYAIDQKQEKIANFLVKEGANISTKFEGKDALDLAKENEMESLVKKIKQRKNK